MTSYVLKKCKTLLYQHGGFPSHLGYPLVKSSNFYRMFIVNHPAIGVHPSMETTIYSIHCVHVSYILLVVMQITQGTHLVIYVVGGGKWTIYMSKWFKYIYIYIYTCGHI